MGKSKAKKYKIIQRNPTGLPSEKQMEQYELYMPANIDTGTIESIIEKLQSSSTESRECAAVIIANMAGDSKLIASLLEKKVIRIASPLLMDSNMSVRHAIAGCLRNIAVCGNHTVSEAMVEQDIMTSLVLLLQQYSETWAPIQSSGKAIDSKSAIFTEACNLLWTLCENSDLAVSIFNEKNLLSILLPCLNAQIYGFNIALSVAHCIYTISENNPSVIDVLKNSVVSEQLISMMNLVTTEPEEILLKSLAAGITQNIFSSKLEDCMGNVIESVLNVVSFVLNDPIIIRLENLSQQIISHKTAKSNKHREETEVETKMSLLNNSHAEVLHLLSAKQTCLEILGNMFEDDVNEEWEDASSSESELPEMEIDESNVFHNELNCSIPAEIHKCIINQNVLIKITEQIVLLPDEMLQSLTEYPKAKDCLKRLDVLRCTALLCLNNIIQKLSLEDIGGASKLVGLWLNVADLLFKKTDMKNTEQVEATARCLSAILTRIAQEKCSSHFNHMTPADLELLSNICRQSPDASTQVHIIRCLGTIGCILSNLQSPASANLITVIGQFLLDVCSQSADLWVTAETLDVIFDVFGEDHVDSIAREIGLVEKLSHLLPIFKAKVKQQRKSFGEHLPVIKTVQTNLIRFIKYKSDLNKK